MEAEIPKFMYEKNIDYPLATPCVSESGIV